MVNTAVYWDLKETREREKDKRERERERARNTTYRNSPNAAQLMIK